MNSKVLKVRKHSSVEAFNFTIEVVSHINVIVRLCLTREDLHQTISLPVGEAYDIESMELSLKVIEKINGWYTIEVTDTSGVSDSPESFHQAIKDQSQREVEKLSKENEALKEGMEEIRREKNDLVAQLNKLSKKKQKKKKPKKKDKKKDKKK
jgi:tRNA uridine 5-carbamoylmethylation protein Kti12